MSNMGMGMTGQYCNYCGYYHPGPVNDKCIKAKLDVNKKQDRIGLVREIVEEIQTTLYELPDLSRCEEVVRHLRKVLREKGQK